jgi:hypothetical protein
LWVLLVEGRPQRSGSSTDISPLLKQLNHLYTHVVPMASSLKASLSIVTVLAVVFPRRKHNFTHTHTHTHTHCSLRTAISVLKKSPNTHANA